MSPGTRLYLWDIDGTLVLYRGVGRRAAEAAFGEVFALPDPASKTRGVPLAGSTDPKILRSMAIACGVAEADFEARQTELRRIYLGHLQREVAAFQGDPVLRGAREILAALAADPRVKLGLLTGNFEPAAKIKLDPVGLGGFFATGGFGDDHEDRRIVASVARERCAAHHRIEPAPSEVFVVGDTIHDVDCARAHGFRAIGVCTGHTGRAELEAAGADLVLDDLLDPRAPFASRG